MMCVHNPNPGRGEGPEENGWILQAQWADRLAELAGRMFSERLSQKLTRLVTKEVA